MIVTAAPSPRRTNPLLTARVGARWAALLSCAVLAGCGGGKAKGGLRGGTLERYIAQVEPIRLGVNRLLEGADPILRAYREHRIGAKLAARRMDALEGRFAEYAVRIASVEVRPSALASLHGEYAHTYVLEDAYLSALAAGLEHGDVAHLPETQAAQRAAIIEWRTGVTVLARKLRVTLPADLQKAGRGEIAPSAQGES